MSRTLRQARRAVPVLSLAALAVIATGTSAHASGACPDPAVEATVNMDGTEMPGCRAIFTYKGETEWWKAPVGGGQARVLLIGGGGGGGNRNLWYPTSGTGGGGGGGAGGEVIDKMVTLEACTQYEVGVGRGSAAAEYNAYGAGIGYTTDPGQLTHISRGSWRIDALGGGGSLFPGFPVSSTWMAGGAGATGGTAGAVGNADGGGGGGMGAGGGTAPTSPVATTKTGGNGGAGQDISASFPGLALTLVGGGGGGFGETAGGTASHGGGGGGHKTGTPADGYAENGVDGTGGGGGGGAQEGPESFTPGLITYYKAGKGGNGTLVIDFPVPASTSCSSGGGGRPGGGSSSASGSGGSGGSSATSTTVKASKPKVTAGGTAIDVSVTAPGAGTALLTGAPASAPKRVTCSASKVFTGTGTARIACVPGAGVQRLRRVKAVRVKLVVAFRPTSGGATQTLSVGTVTLPRVPIGPIPVTG